ncbi:uncharacterized protein LOC129919950 [Episyrphus balteatus]|uniref:uncharacterized protein LOC129919950 n=1 Tax=Episyrphus balteatus TaxID=286459 RepID=UPI0024853855|nr:uncharacterized protein LOC129919950 [Episyrphus balteatus]
MSAKNQELHFLVPFLMNESASASHEVHHGDADISDDAEETTSAVSSGLEPPFSPGTKKSDFMIEIVADMKPLTLVEKKQLKDLILLVALQQKTANELLIDEEPPAASSPSSPPLSPTTWLTLELGTGMM